QRGLRSFAGDRPRVAREDPVGDAPRLRILDQALRPAHGPRDHRCLSRLVEAAAEHHGRGQPPHVRQHREADQYERSLSRRRRAELTRSVGRLRSYTIPRSANARMWWSAESYAKQQNTTRVSERGSDESSDVTVPTAMRAARSAGNR